MGPERREMAPRGVVEQIGPEVGGAQEEVGGVLLARVREGEAAPPAARDEERGLFLAVEALHRVAAIRVPVDALVGRGGATVEPTSRPAQ